MVTTTRNDFSNGTINGSPDDDTVNLTGNGSNVAVLLGAGQDTLNVTGRYTNLTVQGGADDDTISGVGSFSVVNGNTGDDSINLNTDLARSVTVFGGQGDDTFANIRGRDLYVFGNIGNESIDISNATGSNYVYGGQDSDLITGSLSGNDFLSGDLGSDTIRLAQGAANSRAFGGQGNDAIGVNVNSGVLIYGGQGNDSVGGVAGLNFDNDGRSTTSIDIDDNEGARLTNSAVFGNLGNDTLFVDGDSTDTSVYGGQGNDTLLADQPNNDSATNTANTSGGRILLSGDLGDDILVASGANVTMSGGQGIDFFDVNNATVDVTTNTTTNTTTVDDTTPLLITDFQTGVDSITFEGDAGINFASSSNSGNYVEFTNSDFTFQTAYNYANTNRDANDGDRYTFIATGNGSYLFHTGGDTDTGVEAVQLGNLTTAQFQASDIVGADTNIVNFDGLNNNNN